MKLKSLFVLSIVVFMILSWRFIDNDPSASDPSKNAIQIRLRNVGHQLLLSAGDSTSRVLPVKSIGNRNFRIQFESQLALNPDTLVDVVSASMEGLSIDSGYTVNVVSCDTDEVVYGFEIHGDAKNDIVPCLGRSLPKSCYVINIEFQRQSTAVGRYAFILGSFLSCLVLAFLVLTQKPKVIERNQVTNPEFIQLGKFKFFHEKQLLQSNKQDILLTSKENEVLNIFASNPNQVIARDQLQKEVWENQGVVVGRSLDVFISKLRKKLEAEPAIQIVNIHGKGYKLQVA